MAEIPKRITEDQYDKIMRKLWEIEQRITVVEKQVRFDTSLDELYAQQAMIKKMLTKIGVRLFKRAMKP